MRRVLYTIALGCALRLSAASDPPLPVAAIERYAREEMSLNRMPGLALAVVRGDQVLLRAFGVRSLRDGAPMRPDTPMELASVSKPLTAVAAAQLVRAGRLEWDQPASLWLPALRDSQLSRVTVRHLTRHRSGLRRAHDRLVSGADRPGEWDLGFAVERLSRARLWRPPGTFFAYANANYVLLAAVVEAAAGMPFDRYMETHVFAPLGMMRSTLDAVKARAWGAAELHELRWGRVRPAESTQSGWLGASLVKSTAQDMAVFLAAILRGEVEGLRPGQPLAPPYDAGWFVHQRVEWAQGRPALEHSGDIWGANAALVVVPEADLGVAILINAGVNRALDVARAVASCVLGGAAPQPSRPHWTRVADNWAQIFAVVSALLLAYLAVYWARAAAQIRRRERVFRWPGSWWERGRLALLAAMASYLFGLGSARYLSAVARPPSSLRLAVTVLAWVAGTAFLTAAAASVWPARRQD